MEESCDVNLVTFFGDVITITSLKWHQNWFFKARFRQKQFEKPQFGQIMQLQVTKSMIKRGVGGGEHTALGDFW